MAIGRNDPCPCGSGKKYKQCCLPVSGPAPASGINSAALTALLQQAMAHLTAGRWQACEATCLQVLRQAPEHSDALHLLGMLAHQVGKHQQALELMNRALLRRTSPSAELYLHRGVVLQALQSLAEAAESYRRAIAINPSLAAAHAGLAHASKYLGEYAAALSSGEQAVRLDPQMLEAQFTLGTVLHKLGRMEEAEATFRKVLQQLPDSPECLQQLGDILQNKGALSEAEACYRRSVALKPDASPYNNLGQVLQAQGRLDEAMDACRQALQLDPSQPAMHSNLLMTMQYVSHFSPEDLYRAHCQFAARFEAPLKPLWRPHDNIPDVARRLKIGYVSGDLRKHVVSNFMEPILANHDHTRVEIYCYHNYGDDEVSEHLKTLVDRWCNCARLSDEALAARIRADAIDILVDLSGHTALNRLPVFARKPAPVQVTWLGYPGTTGLEAMDYRLTDHFLDPVGMAESCYSEKIFRLPHCVTFKPAPDSPEVNELPALATGCFTLACLNNLTKINQGVVQVWARILKQLPNARLMLGNVSEPAIGERLTAAFAAAGIAADRLCLQPKLPLQDFLALHHHIDLALDPFPYGGGTTTNHALWMGVPVVTLSGATSPSRQGAALLAAAGLDEFITRSEDEYVSTVLSFAADLPALNSIRQSLRTRSCENSGAGAVEMTRNLEQAFFSMWESWCRTQST